MADATKAEEAMLKAFAEKIGLSFHVVAVFHKNVNSLAGIEVPVEWADSVRAYIRTFVCDHLANTAQELAAEDPHNESSSIRDMVQWAAEHIEERDARGPHSRSWEASIEAAIFKSVG